jgi:hypothetical protein
MKVQKKIPQRIIPEPGSNERSIMQKLLNAQHSDENLIIVKLDEVEIKDSGTFHKSGWSGNWEITDIDRIEYFKYR